MADRYEIKGRLGRGGIGAVYQAFDHHLGRDVAIKRLLPIEDTRLNDDTAENSLQSEAKALASLSHPNIVTIFEFGEDEKGPFVVFELIDGDTLKDLIAEGALSESDFYEVADQILDALVAAQKMNILHRDIKPANIMLSWLPSGKFQIKMLDFGLSKFAQGPSTQTLDQQGSFLGSIDYIAPEQIELFPLDQRTDLYSLGCVLYFALTQRAPFTGGSMAETMNNHLAGKAVALEDMRPDIPIAVCRWVMSLVSLHPSERPDDALSAMATLAEAKSISNTSITDSISTAKLVVPVVETAQPSMQPRVLEHTQQIVSTPAPMGPVVPPHPNPNGGNSKMVKGRYKKKPKPPGASRKAIFGLVGSILALMVVGGVIMSNDRKQRNIAAEKERLAKAAEQPAQPSTATGDTPNQPPEAKPDSTNFANTVAPGPPGLSSDQSLAAYYSFPAGFKNTDGEPLTLDSSNKLVGAMINGAPNAHELHFLKSGEIVNPPQLGANWHGAPTIQIAPNKRLTTTHRGAKSQAMVSEKFTMSFMIRTPEDSNGTILRTAIQDGANTYHNKAFKIAFYKEVMNLFTDSEEEKAQLQFPTKEYRFLMLELDTSEQRISIWNRQRNRNEPFVESPQITFDFPGPIQLQNYEIGNFVPKTATHNKRVEIIAISVHTDLLSMDQKNELANYFYMLTK